MVSVRRALRSVSTRPCGPSLRTSWRLATAASSDRSGTADKIPPEVDERGLHSIGIGNRVPKRISMIHVIDRSCDHLFEFVFGNPVEHDDGAFLTAFSYVGVNIWLVLVAALLDIARQISNAQTAGHHAARVSGIGGEDRSGRVVAFLVATCPAVGRGHLSATDTELPENLVLK